MKKILCGLAIAASTLTVAGTAMIAGTAHAHHSLSAYDIGKTIELEGTVKRFEWGSPHCWVVMDVPKEGGGFTEWVLEAGTPVVNTKFGWKRDDLKPGDKLRATAFPTRDGSAHGALMRLVLADGRTLEGPLATYLNKK